MQTFRDILSNEFILSTLLAKHLKALYRNMALGFFWALLQPLVMVAVLSYVLVYFLKGAPDAPAMIVVALIPYNYIAYCINGCVVSISGNASLVKKVAFPRQILPISIILTHLVHFSIQCTLIIPVLLIFPPPGDVIGIQLLWLIPIFAVHLGLCVGAGMLVAGLNVVYRDVQYIVESVLTVMFWLSPVLYDAHAIFNPPVDPQALYWASTPEYTGTPMWIQTIYWLNPVSGVLDAYRSVLYRGMAPDMLPFGLAVLGTTVVGFIGLRSFWVHERQFADLM